MKTYTFDIETYRNYNLYVLRDIDSHELVTFEVRGSDECLTPKQIKALYKLLTENKIITFNGLKFDEPITAYALKGKSVKKVFEKVQELIDGESNSIYAFYKATNTEKFITNHIDIMDVARGQASLKLYGARLGTKKLQDLPYEPHLKLTDKQMDEVLKYCENDNILTEELYRYLKPDLELREAMSEQYGENFMSFKAAKIAEIVIAKECGYTGKAPSRPDTITYEPPKYIKFKDKRLKAILKQLKSHTFNIGDAGNVEFPDFLKEKFEFDGMEYQFGIGGLHGSVSSTSIYSTEDEVIVDIDYKSLYPSLIIENDFSPKHIGSKFSGVYKEMYHQRNNVLKPAMKNFAKGSPEYIDLDRKQDSMKLVLNSSFGQTGQRFSKIYDPKTMLSTTITGQLTLMMVIEKLYRKGFHTFYANTDGITLKVRKEDVEKVQNITRKFDKKTGLDMEYNYFRSSHIRDVNNFVNITVDGAVKSKGTYAEPNLEKNSHVPIVFEAVRKYLQNGTPIQKTIKDCNVVKDFCSSRLVTGGAMYATKIPPLYPDGWDESLARNKRVTKKMLDLKAKLEAEWVTDNGNYLGKVVRWYYSKDGSTIHYKKSGNKVPMSDGCRPMMELTDELPEDLDYTWYYEYAYRMLEDLGVKL